MNTFGQKTRMYYTNIMRIEEMTYDPKGSETGILYKMQLDLMRGLDDAAAMQWIENEGNSEALRLLCEARPELVRLYQKDQEEGLRVIRQLLEEKKRQKQENLH